MNPIERSIASEKTATNLTQQFHEIHDADDPRRLFVAIVSMFLSTTKTHSDNEFTSSVHNGRWPIRLDCYEECGDE